MKPIASRLGDRGPQTPRHTGPKVPKDDHGPPSSSAASVGSTSAPGANTRRLHPDGPQRKDADRLLAASHESIARAKAARHTAEVMTRDSAAMRGRNDATRRDLASLRERLLPFPAPLDPLA